METKEMTIEALEERKKAIGEELNMENADLDALEEEVRKINAELETRKAEEQKKVEMRNKIANDQVNTTIVKEIEKEGRNNMEIKEVRSSREYMEAYANYIKTGKDTECRALLTENTENGVVPVPTLVEDKIRTAWENERITALVKKTYIPGNLKVGFERSAGDASIHVEGAAAPSEEQLLLGIVTLVPESIKKWITISDEALDLKGQAFLDYVYDEIAHKIAKKVADEIVKDIYESPSSATATAPNIQVLYATPAVDTVVKAIAKLTDEATNPVIICNKESWADFLSSAKANKYATDPFEKLEVIFNNSLSSYSAAQADYVWCIVGDLQNGALINLPNGNEITFKFDDKSLAEKDLVKIVGREFVGHGVVAPDHFCCIKKAAG